MQNMVSIHKCVVWISVKILFRSYLINKRPQRNHKEVSAGQKWKLKNSIQVWAGKIWCLSKFWSSWERIIAIVVRHRWDVLDRNALQDYSDRHAHRTQCNAEQPKLPVQWHGAGKCTQKLDYDDLEDYCGRDDSYEYPVSDQPAEDVDLLNVTTINFIEHLDGDPRRMSS